MPVCTTCARWTPPPASACIDCGGHLADDPAWAKPGLRPLAMGRQAEKAERLRRTMLDPRKSDEKRAAAAADFETARRRYEELAAAEVANRERRSAETAAAARAAGLSVKDYQARQARELRERRFQETGQYRVDPGGMGQAWLITTVLAFGVGLVGGLVLLVVLLVLGTEPRRALAGTLAGLAVGLTLSQTGYFLLDAALDWLAPRSYWVRHHADGILDDWLLVLVGGPLAGALIAAILVIR